MATEFATIKVTRAFAAWVKVEAARRGIPMYELIEEMVARGVERPWRKKKTAHANP